MIFEVTEIMTWMECRRKHSLQSFNGLSLGPLIPKPYFALGSTVHRALEAWKLSPTSNLNELYAECMANTIISRTTLYKERVGAAPSNAEMADLLENLVLGAAMMKNYQDYHKAPLLPNTELISAEQTVTVPVPNTEHQLSGTFDALIRLKNGRIAPLDHKTYSTRPNDDMIHRSFQFTAYIWITNQLIKLGVLESPSCNQLAYDGMWCRDGSKHKLSELFHRELTSRTANALQEFENNLPILVNEMATPTHKIHHVPWNGCFNCDVKSICVAMTNGDTPSYDRFAKREKTHARLEVDE